LPKPELNVIGSGVTSDETTFMRLMLKRAEIVVS